MRRGRPSAAPLDQRFLDLDELLRVLEELLQALGLCLLRVGAAGLEVPERLLEDRERALRRLRRARRLALLAAAIVDVPEEDVGHPLRLVGRRELGRGIEGRLRLVVAPGLEVLVEADRQHRERGRVRLDLAAVDGLPEHALRDRKSTRLNSSHVKISYAVFCLKKKKQAKVD